MVNYITKDNNPITKKDINRNNILKDKYLYMLYENNKQQENTNLF